MSDDSGWWARKLGARQEQPQAPAAYAPQNYPGHQSPQGPQPYPQQQWPQQAPQQPQQPPQFDPTQARVTTENLFAMAGQWKGGPAHRTDTEPCPECGSPQYFSRTQGMSRLPAPAPHCYNCGYNGGLFSQGDPTTWGATG